MKTQEHQAWLLAIALKTSHSSGILAGRAQEIMLEFPTEMPGKLHDIFQEVSTDLLKVSSAPDLLAAYIVNKVIDLRTLIQKPRTTMGIRDDDRLHFVIDLLKEIAAELAKKPVQE